MKLALHIVFLFIAVLAFGNAGYAQDSNKPPFKPVKRYTPLPLTPQFQGGRDSLAAFIKEHTHYPASARKHGVKGVIEVDFLVTKEGTLQNIRIFHSLDRACDKEAIRVVKLMPKWQPGMMGRDPMEMDYHVNIPFGVEAPKQNYP
jgi:protein TonB